ncbi:hypothetical protein BgiMline_023974 [Biomphalaria glabrata]|nr:hypothetical protein BgiMline_007196 [Biomphalaria glabrata]
MSTYPSSWNSTPVVVLIVAPVLAVAVIGAIAHYGFIRRRNSCAPASCNSSTCCPDGVLFSTLECVP